MIKKRPVDIKRDSGGSADIGSIEDGAIVEMFEFVGKLLIIKEKAIYVLNYADDIDPKREYPDLPSSAQQLFFRLGADSEIVSRTFLTATRLFKKEFFPPSIDLNRALQLSFESLQELAALDNEITEYLDAEKRAINEYNDRIHTNLTYAIPSITDVKTRCATIFQKADHVLQSLMELIRLFYPKFSNEMYYSSFCIFINDKYGESDTFTKFLKASLPHIQLIRNIRNCLDHRRSEIIIKDFEPQLNLDILTPTIEINHNNSKLTRTPLASFLPQTVSSLVNIFECMIAYLSSNNVRTDMILPCEITFIPEEKRNNKFIQYGFWTPIGGGFFRH